MYLLPGNQLQASLMLHWSERSLRLTSGSRVSKCTQRERCYSVSDPPVSVSAPHAPILRMRPGEAAALLADSEPQKGEALLTSEGLKPERADKPAPAGVLTSVGEAEACSARTLLLA